MSEIVEEAYELVEHGLIGEPDLQSMLFDNAIAFWTANNPTFFRGTAVNTRCCFGEPKSPMTSGVRDRPASERTRGKVDLEQGRP